jgi:hypothetical protein
MSFIIIIGIFLGVNSLGLYAAQERWPYKGKNFYLLSYSSPEDAEKNGFPSSLLSDNIQKYFLGRLPSLDNAGNAAFYSAFREF